METESSGAACLLCVQCKDAFHSPWDLMVHVQAAHMLNIYELGVPSRKESSTSPPPLQDTPPPPAAAVCPLENLTNDDMVSLCFHLWTHFSTRRDRASNFPLRKKTRQKVLTKIFMFWEKFTLKIRDEFVMYHLRQKAWKKFKTWSGSGVKFGAAWRVSCLELKRVFTFFWWAQQWLTAPGYLPPN